MTTLEIISLFLITSIVCAFTGFVIYNIIKDGRDLIKDIKKEHKS